VHVGLNYSPGSAGLDAFREQQVEVDEPVAGAEADLLP
jgi:hypothetical protein